MRKAMNPTTSRNSQTVFTRTIPAPVGGLNSRDPLSQMKPEDALILENFICRPTHVELRKGQADHATLPSVVGAVKSLIPYRDGTSNKLFAGTDFGIFDVTAGGTISTSERTCTNGEWISVNAANAGIRYLVMVNGVDDPVYYDGTSWHTAVMTGITDPTKLSNLTLFNFRLFFTEEGSLSFWFLGVNAVQGAIQEFPLGNIFKKGGALQAISSWSVDSGTGADDYAVFITTEGEVAVYKGIDPSNADTWALVGVYELPKPVGKKCLYRQGGELLVITQSGIVSVAKMLQSIAVDRTTSISDKTRGELSELATANKDVFGWEMLRYSEEDLLIVNAPNSTRTKTVQMCMNTLTGAWSKFTAMNAYCFAELNGNLYYGSEGKVVQALTGTDDFGTNITAKAKTAFNYFGLGLKLKHIKMLRPNFYISKKLLVNFALSLNYQVNDVISQSSTSPNGISLFNHSFWNQSYWAGADFIDDQWRTVAQNPGYCFAMLLQINDKGLFFQWNTTDFVMEAGTFM